MHSYSFNSIDGVFIGPYDLSLSLGFPPPNPDPHPKVEEAIQNILQAAHKAGKKWWVFLSASV
jgi:4-hydroxy-2-oxoheptanedioate aldolase